MTLRRLHLLVGLAGVILFIGTGLVMHWRYDHLRGMTDAARLLFRSTHIYLLLAALLNVVLGLYLQPARGRWPRRLQQAGSVLVLVGPLLFLAAFLQEPFLGGLLRPWTRPAVYGTAIGVGLHLAAMGIEDSAGAGETAGRGSA